MIVGAVLLDFTCYGFTSRLESYSSNKIQRVVFNGSFSNIRYVQCGIPQGS
jgi:hypothetical protein